MVESIRFSGLASGLDTQSIVDSMMRAERLPLDRVNQKKQVLEWQRDDYREMNKLLKEFDTYLFDNIYKQSNMLKRTTSSSNSNLVTATASASAGNVSYDIKNVILAKAARRESATGISKDANGDTNVTNAEKIDPTKSLISQASKFGNEIEWKVDAEFTSNSFTVPKDGASEFQLTKGAIDSIKDGKITANGKEFTVSYEPAPATHEPGANKVYVNKETGKLVFSEKLERQEGNETFSVDLKSKYLQFDVKTFDENGNPQYKNFKFSGTTSLNSMFSTINNADAGINIFYDTGSDKVVAMRTETGNLNPNGAEMAFVEVTRDGNGKVTDNGVVNTFFTSVLGLTDAVEEDGSDAKFTINGLETTRKSNTFTMNDVTFTLNKSTATGVGTDGKPTFSDESSSVNIKTDTEAIVGTIKEFVEKYNELLGKINGELTEERFTSFTPLTSEQKAAMKEKEIEEWESKAKSGMLRRDSLLTSGLSSMRNDLYAQVVANERTLTDSKYNQLAEIGIKTSKDYLERGKLELDEDKLKAAIEDNPEAVYQLFMADGTQPDGKIKYEEHGLARRLRDSISGTMEKVEAKAGNAYTTEHNYAMGKNLLRMKEDITRIEDRLKQREQRYWNQFNAMETAMQKLNDQSTQLLSQLGMNNK